MIRIFALNVSEELLNKFKDVEIHTYSDDFSNPVVEIYENNTMMCVMYHITYDGVNSYLEYLRGREASS